MFVYTGTSKYVLCPVDVDSRYAHLLSHRRIVDRRVFELRKTCVRIFWIGNGRGRGYLIIRYFEHFCRAISVYMRYMYRVGVEC